MSTNRWALRAQLATLRTWAEQNYAETLAFWLEFADRVIEAGRGKDPAFWNELSALYAEYEERGYEGDKH